jgi:UDP:flavonoid glycosyltransferase YjiC (YdhE family)
MVPLARALTGTGHEVAFATAPRFCRGVVEPAGFRAFGAGLSPLQAQERLAGSDTDEGWQTGARLFAAVAGPAKVPELAAAIEAWDPAVVVHDAVDFAGPVAAARCGRPWASHSFGALQPPRFWELADSLSGRPDPAPWSRGPMFAHLYLDICPPSLQAPHIVEVPTVQRMRPVSFDTPRGERLADWVSSLPPGPTVYITLGTVFNNTPGVFETVLEGLGGEPYNVIVTVGPDRDPSELGHQPANVHIERYLPHSLLLPHCDLVVAHGGSGTTFAALAHGLPLLILSQGANQEWNAQRCAELGVGITLSAAELTPAGARSSVAALLDEPRYRAAARRVQTEIAHMPGPETAVAALEKLVR